MILDEATSALDTGTGQDIQAALLARDGLYARMWALQAEQETKTEPEPETAN